IVVNRLPVADRSIEAIAAALGKAVPGEPGDPPVVVINADAKATHQSVVDVMQAAQRAGLPHITFATQAPAQ
ncbi:ExbD/TolR family protein, partial [Thauera sp.]